MCHDSADGLDEGFRRLLASGQSLASVLLDYEICVHCQHVYKMRTTRPYSCPACNAEIHMGRGYTPLVVCSLIDLMQDQYRMELSRTNVTGGKIIEQRKPHHYVAIILLSCTLVECWMDHFLWSLMVSRDLPKLEIDRLLSDNWRLADRKGRLFTTLTNEPFGNALRHLTEKNKEAGGDLNYERVWAFVQDANKSRNDILHKGAIHRFPEDLIEKCIKNIHGVNQLFISLHNRYIAKR